MENILERLRRTEGSVSLYYLPLDGGEPIEYRADEPMIAASVIKLPVMVEAFRQMRSGRLDADGLYTLRERDKVPPCGVLTLMHEGLQVTLADLITLMIVVSDNTATNMLIDILGMDSVNRALDEFGASGTRLRRKLFDAEASARGVQNTVTAREIGDMLAAIARGQLVSPEASRRMTDILLNQQLNGKFPFYLDCPVAHKTGEDDGITHDAGVIYAKRPFVLCMFSNGVDVPAFERLMQDAALAFYRRNLR